MVERLKSWESPRKRGRNHKGKGGTARARQLKKREKLLRKKLQQNQNIEAKKKPKYQEEDLVPPLFFCEISLNLAKVSTVP
ncbi:hypothetical protein Xen7305DRAFT_00050150 [Xenococcus sp. PCC 7305]|uniref:hypothetical protein n=1 Tax=Xenococcus sp. PCC 7305 TaxID=102125 RepID=UPI0002AC2387|nr:hypothetical protein [Xenococcus sp. PCC 7305]ELS05272.1 hypothetical protein Xen7305DRAFT_00050150 [Xenococcus sp. PCC 7305]